MSTIEECTERSDRVLGGRDLADQSRALEALRRSEIALRESEERFRLAACATREVIWDWDLGTNRITTNDGIEQVLGYPASQVGPEMSWWLERIHREDRERVLAGIGATLDGIGSDWSDEYRFRRADGTYALVIDRARVARDADGQAVRMIGALADVTRQRRAEEAARRAQKLESLTVLAGGVAHDFNNLLMVVMGRISLALGRLPEGNAARADLETALGAGQRAAELADKMLTFSGGRHFRLEHLDPNRLVQDARADWEPATPSRIRLTVALDPVVPPIEADAAQLRQALANLVLNAVEAIGDREGTVRVATGVRDVTADDTGLWRHTTRPLQPGRYVFLEVADDGCGLDGRALTRLFEPFFSTKFTGRGLGLAAVLGIVRGHRGGITVTSEPGRGARFTVFLPTTGPAGTARAAGRPRNAGRAVLVIDDEPMVRELVETALEAAGIPVLAASGGAEGVALYRARRDEIGLVLLDLSMPDMDGAETFRILKAQDPGVRVILTSGYAEAEATRGLEGAGLVGFLHKPCAPDTLVRRVREALAPQA